MVLSKKCSKCQETKLQAEYHRKSCTFDGLHQKCKTCRHEESKTYYHKNRDRLHDSHRKWRAANSGYVRQKNQEWRDNNRDKYRKYLRDYHHRNPHESRYRTALRRAKLKQATPPWADLKAIKEFYKNCPEGYQVDHIHPLNGKTICGLHTIENLQYLTISENKKKGNRLI